MNDDILFREAWPSAGIESYHSVHEGVWGYLILHRTKGFIFDSSVKPTPEEILKRWGYRFSRTLSEDLLVSRPPAPVAASQ